MWWKCILKFFRYEWTYYKDHRETPEYQKRVKILKTWWIWFGVGILVLLQLPNTYGMIVAGILAMVFLSFGFLDEWKHFRKNCDDDE